MNDANFGKTNIELEDLKYEVDLDSTRKILIEKDISNPDQKLDLYLDQVFTKIRQLPEDGDQFSWRAEESVDRIYITEIFCRGHMDHQSKKFIATSWNDSAIPQSSVMQGKARSRRK